MKRVLSVLGVFALLGTLLVVVTISPAAAQPETIPVDVDNFSNDVTLAVTFTGCGYTDGPHSVAPGAEVDFELAGDCTNWDGIAVDEEGECRIIGAGARRRVEERSVGADDLPGTPLPNPPGNVVSGMTTGQRYFLNFDTDGCVGMVLLEVDKDMLDDTDSDDDSQDAAGMLTTFDFTITRDNENCSPDEAFGVTGDDLPPVDSGTDEYETLLYANYLENNVLKSCKYTVTELGPPPGWSFDEFSGFSGEWDLDESSQSAVLDAGMTVMYCFGHSEIPEGPCEAFIGFRNTLDPLPLTITKTFTGRDYYTTIDRADFHFYAPGLCGAVPMDPFGGLLGSVGVFRTINASQLPQIVLALPNVVAAGGEDGVRATPCTYRVQENNAPEGCVAVDPTGSNADGPYWEQTWVPGETVAFNFNIVNNCAEPEPTPEPTVAPTSTPKKPGTPGAKKPSGGGSTAPKFTG